MHRRILAGVSVAALLVALSGCWIADALKPQPDVTARYAAAKELYAAGEYAKAEVAFKSHLDAYPNTALAAWDRYYIGRCYQQQGLYAKGIAEFEDFLKDPPLAEIVPWVRYDLGNCYRGMGKIAEAKAQYDKALAASEPDSELAGLARAALAKLKNAPPPPKTKQPEKK